MNSKKFLVLITEPIAPEGIAILKNHKIFDINIHLDINANDLKRLIPDCDCLLVRSQTTVDRELITAAKKLKMIGRAGVGLDNIDIDCAKKKEIAVINTPSANSISTAELAFGLMLTLARKILFAHNHLKDGGFKRNQLGGCELFDKTLGLIGFGNVGQQVAQRARAFGMKVMAYDPYAPHEGFAKDNVSKVSVEHIFAESDFISLHCSLSEETKNIVDERKLARIKPGAMLINTARGELIDDEALLKALDDDRVAYAALDVFRSEPPAKDDPLLNHPKTVITPHLGASTTEAQRRASIQLAEQTVGYFMERLDKNGIREIAK